MYNLPLTVAIGVQWVIIGSFTNNQESWRSDASIDNFI